MSFNNLTLVSKSNTPVVSNTLAKSHCRIYTTDDDALIDFYISAAQAFIEGPNGIGVPLLTQQWTVDFDRFYWDTGMVVPMFPVQSIDSVTYRDMQGNTQTLANTIYDYNLSRNPVSITNAYNQSFPSSLPVQKSVTVHFTCGYGDNPSDVPQDILAATLLLVSHYYENRSAVVGIDSRDSPQDMPFAVQAIVDKYRVIAFA